MIGLGTWGLSGESYGKLSAKLAKKIILNCIKKKIYFIDTATTYGNGRVESIIGDLVKKKLSKEEM
jgi:aryl-alcohol dehydrogenase-like predicted oxidoreductase